MSLKINNLKKEYKTGNLVFKALDKIHLEINDKEIVVILGPSGSGKSTLLNLIGGIDLASDGEIIVGNKKINEFSDKFLTEYRRDTIGFIFQFYNLIPNMTVYENVEVSQNISKNSFEIEDILNAVGMLDFKNRFPKELSGGQQQRVSIARAIVKNPQILLCDEPTGALDYEMSIEILKVLKEINQKYNTTILIVTHNNAISNMANRIIKLRSGKVIENKLNECIINPERIEW